MTTRLTREEVRHVARLARLELDEERLEGMRSDLEAILEHFAELDAVDVTGVEPTHHAVPLDTPLRPDRPRPPLHRDEVMAGAPDPQDGTFAVPRVLGEE